MKILIYSHAFLPSLGGIEIVSATLAEQLVDLGHTVTVVTQTSHSAKDNHPYQVVRNPNFLEKIKLILNHELVHSNGASMALFFYAKLLGRPFIWTHGGYQLSCIDGLGWVEGERAPLSPWASVKFHYKKRGLKFALIQTFKLYLRRMVSKLVAANVAITNWVSHRQPLPKQTVIYNPFPLEKFYSIARDLEPKHDFLYVGRLVSEKGVPVLVKAFAEFCKNITHTSVKLAIVGDGNWREKIEAQVQQLGLGDKVIFYGKQTGEKLYDIISKSSIAIVPSVWEEAMGGVAIELMAAGKNLIVSRDGGLSECAGKAALVFENGNYEELALKMQQLWSDKDLQNEQISIAQERLKMFNPTKLTQQYEALYQSLLK